MAKTKAKRLKKDKPEINLKKLPFLMLLFSIYPVIFLFSVNAKEMDPVSAIPSLLACVGGAVVLFVLLTVLLRDMVKAGLTGTVIAIWFFSYGQAYRALSGTLKFSFHFLLLPATAAIAATVIFFIIKSGKKAEARLADINLWGGFIAAALVLISLVSAGMSMSGNKNRNEVKELVAQTGSVQSQPGKYPDIYYILVDAHARWDYLRDIFGYDDTYFREGLKKLGFYIPEKARTNYPETLMSFASFLNYNYLDKIDHLDPNSNDRVILKDNIAHSKIVDFLKSKGYAYDVFTSVFFTGALKVRADHVWQPSGINLTEFGQIFVDTTALPAFYSFIGKKEPPEYEYKRKSTRYVLDNLPETAKLPSPKFVFAYMICPHPPFVFNADGSDRLNFEPLNLADGSQQSLSKEEYIKAYSGQVQYMDRMLLKSVTELMKNMRPGSIIIIHGDHGSGSSLNWEDMSATNLGERMSIFSAYYLPNGGDKDLRPDISPVNNFRMILKNYFGEKIDLLPDKSYFSLWSKPYKLYDVTDKITK